jgi:hypothetical protein
MAGYSDDFLNHASGEQWLNPPAVSTESPAGLDDTLPRGFEKRGS